jgi:2,3-dihydroxy-p-cumate/2,3-dihydroxybenzoate 3,4-dioxygenase
MVSVSDLQYVALAVPDVVAERNFFGKTWGLVEVGEDSGNVYFAAEGAPHPCVIRLRQDDVRKTDLIGFLAASNADVDALFEQVQAAGARVISQPGRLTALSGGYGFRFFDPDGRAMEVASGRAARAHRTLGQCEAIPVGISHVVFHSPDHIGLAQFYEKALGFRVSDWIGNFMAFLRCNSVHHRIAVLPGPPALNHIAFDVPSIDAMMRGLGRMHESGVTLSWGPGRHTAGNNTFSYFLTPNGNVVEYTSDLERVDEATWVPTVYEPGPATIDQWGTGRIITGNVPHAEVSADKGLWQIPV